MSAVRRPGHGSGFVDPISVSGLAAIADEIAGHQGRGEEEEAEDEVADEAMPLPARDASRPDGGAIQMMRKAMARSTQPKVETA
jgi:hypothetical protein